METDPFTVPKIFSVAASAPVVDGVKTRNAVQEELAGIDAPLAHVPDAVLFAKLEAFVPVIVKYGVARTSAAVPVLLIVMTVAELVVTISNTGTAAEVLATPYFTI